MFDMYSSIIKEMIEAFALFEFSSSSVLAESSFTLIDANRALYVLLHSDSVSLLGSTLQVLSNLDPSLPAVVLEHIPNEKGACWDSKSAYSLRLLRAGTDHLACFIHV